MRNYLIFILIISLKFQGHAQENLIINPHLKDMNWCWFFKGLDFKLIDCETPSYTKNENKYFTNLGEFSNYSFSIPLPRSINFFINGSFDAYCFSSNPIFPNAFVHNSRADRILLPKDGNASLTMNLYSNIDEGRDYIQGKLNSPLVSGCEYYFKVQVDKFYTSVPIINSFGVAFIQDSVFYENYNSLISDIKPSIQNKNSNWFYKNHNFIEGNFIAKGGEKYFILGNFKSNDSTEILVDSMKVNQLHYTAIYSITDLLLKRASPNLKQINLGADTTICANELSLIPTLGFKSYIWNTGDTNRILKVNKSGTYIINANYGCGIVSDTILVKKYNYRKNQLLTEETLLKCPNENISVIAISGYSNYLWSNGQTGNELKTFVPGIHRLSALSPEGCSVKDTLEIKNIKSMEPFNLGPDTLICSLNEFELRVDVKNEGITWSNGSKERSIDVKVPGIYSVKVSNKCYQVSDTIQVSLKDCSILSIPNVFTPNNDGVNDLFRIITDEVRQFKIKIHSRWGDVIFKEEHYKSDWNAEGVPDGLYFYEIEDVEYSKNYKGTVQILR
ncbi:MAG: gliding motility-associated C-terminal domain-containing protein [Opitutaceae bacterium]|nr:gliding motility-associated C-terminal domain-containing protein [Cytophagales bacterium]